MVAQYVSTKSLLDLCEVMERAPGSQVGMWWWEQEDINLTGSREAAAAEAEAESEEDGVGYWWREKKVIPPGPGHQNRTQVGNLTH